MAPRKKKQIVKKYATEEIVTNSVVQSQIDEATSLQKQNSPTKHVGKLKLIAVGDYVLPNAETIEIVDPTAVAINELNNNDAAKAVSPAKPATVNGISRPLKRSPVKRCQALIEGLMCIICDKHFTRKYHLDRHLQLTSCSGQAPPSHPCDICGKVYTRKDNLREHLRVHAGEVTRQKKWSCSQCDKMFHGASLLKIHERTHTGEKPFACDHCSKSFPSGGALTKHRRTHTGEKPYSCQHCSASFSLKGTLNRHMRIHNGIRPHKCPHCEKSFIQAGGLKAHMFHHTGIGGFQCGYCNKMFNRKARLEMHTQYVHTKERPFSCLFDLCTKSFARKEDLQRHTVLHTGEKPHICNVCNKAFAIKSSLKLHQLTHTREEPRSCDECGRAFIRKDCLLRHIRKRHKAKFLELKTDLPEDDEDSKSSHEITRVLTDAELLDAIRELLGLLVEAPTLEKLGWPDAPVEGLLEAVIKRCGQKPTSHEDYPLSGRLRENCKLFFTVVIDDATIKNLLNNQTVDEVIQHVLKLAKA